MQPASSLIRQMLPSDAVAISKMMENLAAHHGDEAHVTPDDLRAHCTSERKLASVWLAVSADQQAAGFAVTYDCMNFIRGHGVRHIDLLFVEREFRRHGVGSALVRALVREARALGRQRISVGALTTNEAANRFYQALGFEPHHASSSQYRLSHDAFEQLAAVA